jgi:hypothetical protein
MNAFLEFQGFCESKDQWIVVNKQTEDTVGPTGICEANFCLDKRATEASEWVPLKEGNQECVELGSTDKCTDGYHIRFFKGKVFPSCRYSRKPPKKQTSASVGVPPVQCPPGFSPTHVGRCAQDYDFD